MKTKWKLIFAVMAGIISMAFVFYNINQGLEAEVLKIEPQEIANTFQEEGKVIPQIEEPLYAVSGQEILQLRVIEGQEVKKDQVLAVLDTTELDFQLKQLQAQLTSLQGEQAKGFLEQYESLVRSLELQIKQAKLELTSADTNLQRITQLYNVGAITTKELEDVQKAFETANINLEQQKEALEVLKESYSASGGTTQYYRGRLAGIMAQIEHLEHQIKKSTIIAPIDGLVANLLVKKGDLTPISVPLMTVFQKDSYYVEVFVLTEDIGAIEKGMEVNLIHNQKGENITFLGKVREVSPSAVEKVSPLGLEEQRVKVIVDLLSEEIMEILPGYKLDVKFTTDKRENQLVVPKTILFADKEGYSLWVVKKGKAQVQPIQKGFETDRYVVIEKGLEKGDLVILNPQLEGLSEGKKISFK